MEARVGGRVVRTNALDVREDDVPPEDALAAIRDAKGWIACPVPRDVHASVGLLDGATLSDEHALERALAAAARSHDERSAVDDDVAAVRAALAEAPPDVKGVRAARERVATAAADVESLRERTERFGGMVAALRAAGEEDESVSAQHREAVTALVDAETEHVAAHERLDALREAARRARDARERRLRLEDRERRLERAARAELADRVRPAFERARCAVPDGPWRDAYAIARVARVRAPVVVAGGPFERASRAMACLDAPVVLTRARV